MRESQIQTKILNDLKKIPNSFVVKLSDKWVSGLPDIMFITKGIPYFFEVKTNKGKLTKLQEHTLKTLNKAGAKAYLIRSLNDVREVI